MYDTKLFSAPAPICFVCNQPVRLDHAKTDEDGNAIHEDCYLIKLRRKAGSQSSPRAQRISSESEKPHRSETEAKAGFPMALASSASSISSLIPAYCFSRIPASLDPQYSSVLTA